MPKRSDMRATSRTYVCVISALLVLVTAACGRPYGPSAVGKPTPPAFTPPPPTPNTYPACRASDLTFSAPTAGAAGGTWYITARVSSNRPCFVNRFPATARLFDANDATISAPMNTSMAPTSEWIPLTPTGSVILRIALSGYCSVALPRRVTITLPSGDLVSITSEPNSDGPTCPSNGPVSFSVEFDSVVA